MYLDVTSDVMLFKSIKKKTFKKINKYLTLEKDNF